MSVPSPTDSHRSIPRTRPTAFAPPNNGRLVRNLILAANYVQSHIIHFYHLSALDFVDIAAITRYQGSEPALQELKSWVLAQVSSGAVYPAAPFLPRYEARYLEDTELNILAIKHYLEGLSLRAVAQQAGAIFAGKMPHAPALVPGGVTETVTARKIAAYRSKMKKLQTFVDNCYIPDVLAVAGAFPEYFEVGRGCGNFLAYGVFPESADSSQKLFPSGVLTNGSLSPFDPSRITEDTRHSFFSSGSGLRPDRGETVPQSHKSGAYSWLKAPRYGGTVMEVGPLARVLIAYHSGRNPEVNRLVDSLLGQLNRPADHLLSALGRHAARALECKIVADRCLEWADQLRPGEPTCADFEIPATGHGVGLTEAPRGALGHWIELEDHKIANYQCVVPTTWNCSPRDDRGQLGPVEQALLETPIADAKNPIEATRVVRSFDPCLACAVH